MSRSTGSAYGVSKSGARYTSAAFARCSAVSDVLPSEDKPVVSKSRAAVCQSMTRSTGSEPSSLAET